jgi:glycerol-3-phosphate cytidylyltransferase-like family protein
MSVILTKVLEEKNQALCIRVKYDPKTNRVIEIKNIDLVVLGKMFCIGSLMLRFFKVDINKIVVETDWVEEHRQQKSFFKKILGRFRAAAR